MSFRVFIIAMLALLWTDMPGKAKAQTGQITVPSADGKQIQIGTLKLGNNMAARVVNLPVGKARLIRLPVKVRDVLIANSETANVVVKTPRLIYLVGLVAGTTNAFFLGDNGEEVLRLEISVNLDADTAEKTIKSLIPNSDIGVTAVNNHLFLTGNVRSAQISENARLIASRFVPNAGQDGGGEVINMLAVIENQQVLLQVRVAEIKRDVLKELGVGFQDPDTLNVAAGTGLTTLSSGDFSSRLSTVSPFQSTPFLNQLLQFAPNTGDALTLVINALERHGLVKTLAEPNLTTVSGEPANFLAGGEIPIPIAAQDGQITISQEPFGVSLGFTPVVLNSGRISLRIFTEVSSLSNEGAITLQNISVPALDVRRAETTVELPSGGSIMVAGLLQEKEINGILGVPGLKDLPILGPLFRNNFISKVATEIIIAVTCYLVRPVSPKTIKIPTEGMIPASDYDLYMLGRLHGVYTGDEKITTASLKGPFGYILE